MSDHKLTGQIIFSMPGGLKTLVETGLKSHLPYCLILIRMAQKALNVF